MNRLLSNAWLKLAVWLFKASAFAFGRSSRLTHEASVFEGGYKHHAWHSLTLTALGQYRKAAERVGFKPLITTTDSMDESA